MESKHHKGKESKGDDDAKRGGVEPTAALAHLQQRVMDELAVALNSIISTMPDDEIENTPAFIDAIERAQDVAEKHLCALTGFACPFTPPSLGVYLRYWYSAPRHHFTAPRGEPSVSDMTWLVFVQTEACARPGEIGPQECRGMTVSSLWKELIVFRENWSQSSFDQTRYQLMRRRYASCLVFVISHGPARLIECKAIGNPEPPPPPPPPPPTTPAAGTGARPNHAAQILARSARPLPASLTFGLLSEDADEGKEEKKKKEGDISADERIAMDERKELLALYEGANAIAQWLPVCTRVFSYIDCTLLLMEQYPVIPMPTLLSQDASELKFNAWMTHKAGYVLDDAFTRELISWACRLALPPGSLASYLRNMDSGVVSYASLYRSEYRSRDADAFEHKVRKPTTDWFSPSAVLVGRDVYAREALALCMYHYYFTNRVSRIDWIGRYVVDGSNLRERMHTLMKPAAPLGRMRRMHSIVHIASTFYVLTETNLVRARNCTNALWYWTRCLMDDMASKLPEGDEVASRWTDQFRV